MHTNSLGMAVVVSIVFGVIGIFLTVLGFKVFDWMTPRIKVEEELAQNKNLAVAIVVAAMILGTSIVVASVVGS